MKGFGAQNLESILQHVCFPNTLDLDISNAIWVIVPQVIDRLDVKYRDTIFAPAITTIRRLSCDREKVCVNIL